MQKGDVCSCCWLTMMQKETEGKRGTAKGKNCIELKWSNTPERNCILPEVIVKTALISIWTKLFVPIGFFTDSFFSYKQLLISWSL
jgi:hypothetical protein